MGVQREDPKAEYAKFVEKAVEKQYVKKWEKKTWQNGRCDRNWVTVYGSILCTLQVGKPLGHKTKLSFTIRPPRRYIAMVPVCANHEYGNITRIPNNRKQM